MVMKVGNGFEWMALTKRVVGLRPNHSTNIIASLIMIIIIMMVVVVIIMIIIVTCFIAKPKWHLF